jgi:hypothetical protein
MSLTSACDVNLGNMGGNVFPFRIFRFFNVLTKTDTYCVIESTAKDVDSMSIRN